MIKTIIYSCVFFNETYINLINLLLKSYKLFGNSSDDVDYLIICNPNFQKKIQAIFDNLNISGKIWCIDLKNKFEAGYSRLKIFDYPNINLYNKILYLDCDILVTNSINNILDFQLENKLYCLQEGNTNHQFWGSQFFDKNPNCSAFTSGILLFNNNIIIKDLFSQILLHIHNHITSMLPIPDCLDQPFIVYHAVKNNLYNNQKLINIVINNPNNFNNETISHFPGGPCHYESKIVKMTNYMRDIMFNLNNKEVIPEIMPHNFINTILSNGATMVSKERLINLYKQCNKFNHTNYSFVECGVARGGCLALMKYVAGDNNKIFGFDSFEGMPDIDKEKDIGDYNKSDPREWINKPVVENGINDVYKIFSILKQNFNNTHLIKGYFENTLTIQENIDKLGDIAILRLDGDWYNSVKICLDKLYDKVVDGGVIIIDDYGHFVGAKNATDEFRKENNISSPLIQTDYTEVYWVKENQKNQKYIIQVGAHIGKTSNDFLINNIKDDIQYLLFEPVPYLYKQLCENYKNKKNVKLFNIAISNYNGSLPLYIPSEKNDFSKLVSWASQLASTNENHIKTFVPNCIVEKIEVQCKTLNTIIEEYKIENLEAIYTDTEGHDYDILMDLDLIKHKPDCIIFENKHMDGPRHVLNKNECPKYNYLLNHFYKNGYEFVSETSEDTTIKKKNWVNIHEDIWTCSDKFREDIKDFFKDKSHYKIAEIGSHKGYTTGYLSNIFEKVYAVDNSVGWTNFNKNLNKHKNNIEYIHLDIYKESWDIIPDVDVVFIDAAHSYQQCKSDMYNSIRNFKNLKYIIFDDYGVWEGVQQIVNESLTNKLLIFENYIGLNDVPGLNNTVVKNTSEGIICRTNNQSLINNKYTWENSNIEFLENGNMNAFGAGKYRFIDKYLIKCDFGGREHLLKFNDDYSRFISIRKDDFEVVVRNHL